MSWELTMSRTRKIMKIYLGDWCLLDYKIRSFPFSLVLSPELDSWLGQWQGPGPELDNYNTCYDGNYGLLVLFVEHNANLSVYYCGYLKSPPPSKDVPCYVNRMMTMVVIRLWPETQYIPNRYMDGWDPFQHDLLSEMIHCSYF